MFCPRCGEERVSTETSFCSRCGFLLAGTLELLMTGGVNPSLPEKLKSSPASRRSQGIKQGLFIFLLTFLIVPIIAILTIAAHAEPYAVVIAAIFLAVGGLLRMAYAMMFESIQSTPDDSLIDVDRILLERPGKFAELPNRQGVTAQDYVSPPTGSWQNTNDLQPRSVTEGTTRLLEADEVDQ